MCRRDVNARRQPLKNLRKHRQERQKSRFFIYRELCTKAKKPYKIGPGAFRTELPTKIVLKTGLRPRQARFWKVLGPSWAPFGWLLVTLGRLLGPFWALLGRSWPRLGPSWASLGWSVASLGCFFGIQKRPGPRFEQLLGRARLSFGGLQPHVLNALC